MIGSKHVFKLGFDTPEEAQQWHRAILHALRALSSGTIAPSVANSPLSQAPANKAAVAQEEPERQSEPFHHVWHVALE